MFGRVCCGFVGSDCVLCVGEFGVGLWGVCACCVWESWVWVCGECVVVLCVGEFVVSLWGVCVLCVGMFGVFLKEVCECAVCGTVLYFFVESVCVRFVR